MSRGPQPEGGGGLCPGGSTGPGSMPSAWSEDRFSLGFPLFHSSPRNQMCPSPTF